MDSLASYFRIQLPTYLEQRAPVDPDPRVEALAELARGCAREGHTVRCVLAPNAICASCYSASNVVPQRIGSGRVQIVALVCSHCLARQAEIKNGMKGFGTKWLADNIMSGRHGKYEEVLLFSAGSRIRMVTGSNLDTEVLS